MPVNDILKALDSSELSEKMPSSYNIENTILSNIINVFTDEFNGLIQAIKDIEVINDIDKNFGKSLDYLGSDYNESRDEETDEDYLNRIKTKILTTGSIGDENSIIDGLAGYFNLNPKLFQIVTIGLRLIEVIYPAEIEEDKILFVLKSLKAAGIRLILTKDKFWEDMTYEEIAQLTYEELKKFRYERRKESKINE
mgnify:CR=1 FL=1|jgi:hypothetical protein